MTKFEEMDALVNAPQMIECLSQYDLNTPEGTPCSLAEKQDFFKVLQFIQLFEGDTFTGADLQRFLSIGYNHAGRLLDLLEAQGIITPCTPKGRQILINPQEVIKQILAKTRTR